MSDKLMQPLPKLAVGSCVLTCIVSMAESSMTDADNMSIVLQDQCNRLLMYQALSVRDLPQVTFLVMIHLTSSTVLTNAGHLH